jgi:hypothetical protein
MESAEELALVERHWVSQFSTAIVGIQVYSGGVLTDADGDVTYTMVSESSAEVATGTAEHPETGVYDVGLSSQQTGAVGLYLIYWDYQIDAINQTQETYLEVGPRSPTYDALPSGMQSLVESVLIRFSDLFDSPLGGPHLQVYSQANFGRERIAQLLRSALGRLNSISAPHQTYTLDGNGGKEFPLAEWGSVLEQALYVEIVKHLRRSYVEQPSAQGVSLAYFDRRDYMTRWEAVLRDEEKDLGSMTEQFKIAHMGLGRPASLVGGGVYMDIAPTRIIGPLVARPYYWRMYH